MRRIVLPAVVAAVLAASPLAFAAQTANGTVKAYNAKKHTLVMQDGTVYYLPSHFKDPGFKKGKKVSVTWDMKNGKHEASDAMLMK